MAGHRRETGEHRTDSTTKSEPATGPDSATGSNTTGGPDATTGSDPRRASDGGMVAERGRPRTASGLEPNVAGALSYALGWITGLYFLLTEHEDGFVRFHAAQSVVVFGALTVAYVAVGVFVSLIAGPLFAAGGFAAFQLVGLLNAVIALVALVLWLGLMYMAYQGRRDELPVVGKVANDLLSNRNRTVERRPQ